MSDDQIPSAQPTQTGLPKLRPTIGFVIMWGIDNEYSNPVWSGIMDAAREFDVNLLSFAGRKGLHLDLENFNPAIFEQLNTTNLDGLVLILTDIAAIRQLKGYGTLPIVTVGISNNEYPGLVVDGYTSMKTEIAHLIEDHGRRKILFIKGTEGHPDAEIRFQAYLDVLKEHDLPYDPRMVFGGKFISIEEAEQVAQAFFEQHQIEFDAIATASDHLALGAMQALEKRGVRVPYDVSIVGFDDVPEALFSTSPLTTIQQPLQVMGRRAVELLLAQMRGEQVAAEEVLPAIMVRRQSCGCFSENVQQSNPSFDKDDISRQQIVDGMTQSFMAPDEELDVVWAEQLLDAFITDVNEQTSNSFLTAVDETSRKLIAQGTSVSSLNSLLSALRSQAWSMWTDDQKVLNRAEGIWQQTRVLIGEAALRQQDQRQNEAKLQTDLVRSFGEELITTFDVTGLMELVSRTLPKFGINSFYLALYQTMGNVHDKPHLILAQKEGQRIALDEAGQNVPPLHLLPGELLPEKRFNLLTMPLYFRDDWLGYVVFEVSPRDGAIYETLRGQLSSALEGALLMLRVKERSAELARQQYILDTFMESVPDRIYFKDTQSRFTRVNKAMAQRAGLSSADEMIGKSDFDFFPLEQAQKKYDAEQNIIATGEPILSLKEPDGIGYWAAATKMPLRDENGRIVGTFGISRDITELVLANQMAERAKEEAEEARQRAEAEQQKAEIANRDLAAQVWQTKGQALLNERMRGEQDVSSLALNVIQQLCQYLDVQSGVLYISDTPSTLRLAGAYAKREDLPQTIEFGQTLLGEAALERRSITVNLPDSYLTMAYSTHGEFIPKHNLIMPFVYEKRAIGVIKLESFAEFSHTQVEFLNIAIESATIAFLTAQARTQVNELFAQTREQAGALQAQEEELRATNEELQAQTESLRGSEARLKKNQSELEAANVDLEEKTHILQEKQEALDGQNQVLRDAQQELQRKAEELEQASKYKSEFLANMSHELRTPLNSMLILAGMLSKNEEGNLTPDQMESAQVIHAGGTDLLNLINEILDLAKVEAGKMEFHFAPMEWDTLVRRMIAQFDLIAERKGVAFITSISDDLPDVIVTDDQRLAQVIKNLLSNAFKFTEKGSVSLTIHRPDADSEYSPTAYAAVSVTDSGIGMTPDQQKVVFEAFQQADGSTSRQYGGTGLGLAITREMSQRLGGQVVLQSELGKGSTFTIYLPLQKQSDDFAPHKAAPLPVVKKAAVASQLLPKAASIHDDRDGFQGSDRILLIVEDDPTFARVIFDYAHKKSFKCLIASDGETALELLKRYKPHAMVLDLGLPGISGWEVLDIVKNNPDTRHIPIHIISADDEDMSAFQRGAMSFLTKPVSQEDLEGTLGKIEQFITSRIKSLLLVEDDDVLRLSVRKLIEGSDVAITETSNGQAALEALAVHQFDCMILDLSLPDMSGYELLSILHHNEKLPKCPVIVYTGQALSEEENSELLKYAESVIVKGAKSPERLLDETALFLHRVIADLPEEKQRTIRKLHNQEATLDGKIVLVVDDDTRNAFALSKLLADKGLKVQIATNATKALDMLEHSPEVSLILTDIMMPGMDGYEFMRALRAQPRFKKLPIIALTAKAMKGDREKCLEAGASDYLSKPIDPDRLFSMLRIWLSRE